jgi:Zn-finger nucleic acid-binding protein
MIEVELSERAAVDVDVCRLYHFVWFDMREVETLIPRPLPAAAPETPQAARKAIAMLKVEELAEQARGTDFKSHVSALAAAFPV